jgi:hypothetical protein
MAQFKKGETPPGAIPFSEATAKEMQKRATASHYRKKKGQELVRALLERAVTDPDVLGYFKKAGFDAKDISNELAMHARQIEKAQKQGDTKAYTAVMKAAGYDTIKVETDGAKLLVVDAETLQAADKWSSKKKG